MFIVIVRIEGIYCEIESINVYLLLANDLLCKTFGISLLKIKNWLNIINQNDDCVCLLTRAPTCPRPFGSRRRHTLNGLLEVLSRTYWWFNKPPISGWSSMSEHGQSQLLLHPHYIVYFSYFICRPLFYFVFWCVLSVPEVVIRHKRTATRNEGRL